MGGEGAPSGVRYKQEGVPHPARRTHTMFPLTLLLLLPLPALGITGTLLFSTQPYTGNLVSRANVNVLCSQYASPYNCHGAPIAMVLFLGESLAGFAVNMSQPVIGPTGQPFAPNFTALYTPPIDIYQSLAAAAVLPPGTFYWSGSNAAGVAAAADCNNWVLGQAVCITGVVGSADADNYQFLSGTDANCANSFPLVCICNGGTALTSGSPTLLPSASPTPKPTGRPSSSPTHKPSASPTARPTTEAPSASPASSTIYLYNPTVFVNGAFLGGQTAKQVAARECGTFELCTNYTLLVSLLDGTTAVNALTQVPIDLGASPQSPVYGSNGILLGNSWATLFSNQLVNFTYAGVGALAWTGTNESGLVDLTAGVGTCNNWSDGTGSYAGRADSPDIIPSMTAQYFPCNTAIMHLICACAGKTQRPTARPTLSPSTSTPTHSPSHRPSKSPTGPTTSTPSQSPAAHNIVVFGTEATFAGNFLFGTSIAALAASTCPLNSVYTLGQCTVCTLVLANSSYTALAGVPTALGVPNSTQVISLSASLGTLFLASTWPGLFSSPARPFNGIVSPAAWTGMNSGGYYGGSTCNGWTYSASDESAYLSAPSSSPSFSATPPTLSTCNTKNPLICACISRTTSPSASPTLPTHSPTTVAPSKSPSSSSPTASPRYEQSPVLYSNGTAVPPLFESRANADAICKQMAVGLGLTFDGYHALLAFSSSDEPLTFPEQFNFDSGVQVTSSTGVQIATSWTNLLAATLVNDLSAAGVVSSLFWTGASATGGSSTNCLAWTSSGVGNLAKYGTPSSTTTGWISKGSLPCNAPNPLVCVGVS